MVGATRIELATSRPPDVRATTALSPELTKYGLGDQIWTGVYPLGRSASS